MIAAPVAPGLVDFVGLGEGDQVADGPSHHVPGAVAIALAFLSRAQDSGDVARYGGFFGNDRRHPGLLRGHGLVLV